MHWFIRASLAGALAAGLSTTGTANAQSGRVEAGARKALACQACHGLDGLAKLPDAPHLSGQNPVYLEKALKDYRSGARRHEVMSIAVKALSDEDIRDLAAYYGAIEITVKTR